jgi:hypothetical protein
MRGAELTDSLIMMYFLSRTIENIFFAEFPTVTPPEADDEPGKETRVIDCFRMPKPWDFEDNQIEAEPELPLPFSVIEEEDTAPSPSSETSGEAMRESD